MAKDYIIDSGTSGNWEYIKWNSGRIELFACIAYSGISLTNSTAGTYSADAITMVVPVAISISYITANIALWANPMTSGVFLYAIDKSGLTVYTYFRAHASTSSSKAGVCYHVMGKWK